MRHRITSTYDTNDQNLPYDCEQVINRPNATIGTQYDPPSSVRNEHLTPLTPDQGQNF